MYIDESEADCIQNIGAEGETAGINKQVLLLPQGFYFYTIVISFTLISCAFQKNCLEMFKVICCRFTHSKIQQYNLQQTTLKTSRQIWQ